jgi:hypothetical protein
MMLSCCVSSNLTFWLSVSTKQHSCLSWSFHNAAKAGRKKYGIARPALLVFFFLSKNGVAHQTSYSSVLKDRKGPHLALDICFRASRARHAQVGFNFIGVRELERKKDDEGHLTKLSVI